MAKKKSKSNKKPETVKGMSDILPEDESYWKMIWEIGEEVSELHDFHFIETPVVEFSEVFEDGLDSGTKLSEDEIIKFKPNNVRTKTLALRPEGGIPVMRSYLENQLGYYASPLRAYYKGTMFRKHKSGRKCDYEFRQWGYEIIGDEDPVYDAEIISTLRSFLENLNIKDPVLNVNAVGCKECRPKYIEKLKEYYRYRTQKLCDDCKRFYKEAPLRLLRCDKKDCSELKMEAPIILNHLCEDCNDHFQCLLELIEDNDFNYIPDPYLVGELSYYSKSAFRLIPSEDSDVTLASGGRCDYLAKDLGGRDLETVHGSIDLDKVVEVMKEEEIEPKTNWDKRRKVFFIAVGNQARQSCLSLINKLRDTKIVVMEALGRKSLKKQLKYAKQKDVSLSLIYGQKEVHEGSIIIRNMESGSQDSVLLEDMLDEVRDRL